MSERSRSFGRVADLYNRYRPGPPPALAERLGDLQSVRVLEIGAGTGLVSRFLLGLGADLVAVEPDPQMRAVLERESPGLTVIDAVAESLPLGDGSVALTVVSSAWHWFEQPAATLELARVLVDGGRAFVMGNGFSESHQWFEDWSRIHNPGGGSWERRHAVDAGADLEVAFVDVESFEIDWTWRRTLDELMGMFATYSAVITAPPDDRERMEREVRALIEAEAPSGVVDVPMRRVGSVGVRPPRPNV
ncbi:MAG TPA: class I SAM-dependent methyltransferase [Acidimicrobiales bacterium]|nr:class I SAM-dependent methyltransferase [Acidimicrobiales bacterium]